MRWISTLASVALPAERSLTAQETGNHAPKGQGIELLRNLTLGQYVPGESPLHRLDPRVKMGVLAAAMAGTFWLSRPASLGLLALLLLGLAPLARPVRAGYLLRGFRALSWILVLTFLFNAVFVPGPRVFPDLPATWPGMERGLVLVLRLVVLVLLTSLLTLTTSPLRLCDGLESLLHPLAWVGLRPHEFALVFTIALRFLPTLALEAQRVLQAQMARGASLDRGGVVARARSLTALLVPLFTRAFQHADRLALAMESRGYRGGRGRTRWRPLRLRATDLLMGALALGVLGGVVALERTTLL